MLLASIFASPEVAKGFTLQGFQWMVEHPLSIGLALGGLLLFGLGFLREIRGYLGIRTDGDWKAICNRWLKDFQVGVIDIPKSELGGAFKWQFTCHDRSGREFALFVAEDQPKELLICFNVRYGQSDWEQAIANDKDFVYELIRGLLQMGVLYTGLKVPLDVVQIQTSAPLDGGLTKYALKQKIQTIILARELYGELNDRRREHGR